MNINYHVHTPLCNHATGSMLDYIREAIRLGLKEICFLDHLTLNPADRGLSMTPEEVALYVQAARNLAHRFRDEIGVKVGLEIDFHPDFIALFTHIAKTFDFDVIGGSVHYLGPMDIVTRRGDWKSGKGDTDAVYGHYFEVLHRMLDHDFFDMVCHFDLLKKFGRLPDESFESEIDGLLTRIKDKGLALEVNTSGYGHPVGEAYPSGKILCKCFRHGIPITLGSDAHRPDQLISHYDNARALITAAGYTHLSTFSRRQRGRIPINHPTGDP
ncbi:MAG: histidinol-phosphatase [Pseudomonadota bacterium]